MKRITKMTSGLAALALAASLSSAGEMAPADKVVSEKRVKELEQAIEDQGIYLETSQKGIKLSGYVDTSYTYKGSRIF
jgi:anti-sigma28 factor (negative regulator of flagellin synthesis)